MNTKIAVYYLMLISSLCSCYGKESGSLDVEFPSQKSIYLYATDIDLSSVGIKLNGGNWIEWDGNPPLTWELNEVNSGTYEVYLTASVPQELDGTRLSLRCKEKEQSLVLTNTKGPFKAKNYQRVKLPGSVELKEGKQKITLAATHAFAEGAIMSFRSIELLPLNEKANIIKEQQRAIDSRSDMDWMLKDGYGLMFHWTSESLQPDDTIKEFEDAVNDFDVQKFANMVDETGAGYVMFTIGHAESYCPAPIKSWEKCHPGHTTKRDLIGEIADALNEKGVRLFCYINAPLAFKFNKNRKPSEADKAAFVENFNSILSEMGNRYKQKIEGYWFDSWYQIFEKFQDVPFEEFYKATKVGNEKRAICLNSWIYPVVTPWQDYWAGELGRHKIEPAVNGYMVGGPAPNLPYQALMVMDSSWVKSRKGPIKDPKWSSEDLSKYIRDCMNNQGLVTLNLAIYQDETVGEKSLQVMREVKQRIRK